MEKLSKKKIVVIILIIIVIIFLLIILGVKSIFNKNQAPSKRLNELAEVFYKYYYQEQVDEYKTQENLDKYLSEFKDTGLSINLSSLEVYIDARKIENYDALKSCNNEETKVIIYPKSPYKADDYKVKLILDCK